MPASPVSTWFLSSGFFIFAAAMVVLFLGLFWEDGFVQPLRGFFAKEGTTSSAGLEIKPAGEFRIFLLILLTAASLLLVFVLSLLFYTHHMQLPSADGLSFITRPFFQCMMMLVAGAYILCLRDVRFDLAHKDPSKRLPFELLALILLSAFGAWMAIFSSNYVTLYVGLEVQTLSFYVLVALQTSSLRSNEAGIKYFILGSVASAIFLFGIALIYGATHTLDFVALPSHGLFGFWSSCAIVFVLAGLLFKISAVPFHMWTPDVYEGSPLTVTTLLATASKLVGFALLVKLVMLAFMPLFPIWHLMFVILGILSILIGAFGALMQKNFKRLMAFSSVGHAGFLLLAIGEKQVAPVLVYLTIYVITVLGVFAMLRAFHFGKERTFEIRHYAGMAKKYPWFGFIFSMLMLSLAGIPPLAGFFAKLAVFLALVQSKAFVVAILMALASVVGVVYYLSIVKTFYFDEPMQGISLQNPRKTLIMVLPYFLFTMLYCLFPFLLNHIFARAVVLISS